jgi:hypothetical protein
MKGARMADSQKKKRWTTPELKRLEPTDEILRLFLKRPNDAIEAADEQPRKSGTA